MSKFNYEIHEFNWDIIEIENYLSENGFDDYEIKEVKNDYIEFESKGKIYQITECGEITEMK
jgi:hypothetical protein